MTYDKISDKELSTLLVTGDEKAFKIVFDRHYQQLLRFSVSYTNDIYAAENIVQESFILLWENKLELDADSNLHAFLIKVVKLKTWNYVEKQRRRAVIEKKLYDDLVRELELKLYTLDSINTSKLYITEIENIIQDSLQTLPEQTQTIFKLSRQEYFSNKEIAEQMNLSEKSVEYHITKVLKLIRVELADYLKIIIMLGGV